ncbi:cytochrome P450 [Sorangium sp. So ce1099]|uniref:cytochrome P450 n=1 Tax=Sorangium sp. So ce1099 TaxID=3133331 RepID=UPI003F61F2A2
MAMPAPDILSPEFEANPYPLYRVMRDEFPLFFHEPIRSYVISRYEDVERAFKDPVFSSRTYEWQLEPVHGRTILQMDGKEHASYRNLVVPALRGRDLQERLVPAIERNARELIDGFKDRGEVDFVDEFSTRFPINVIADMFGFPRSDHDKLHAWYTAIIAFFANLTQDPAVFEAGLRTRGELADYLLPIVAQRRADPGQDLLSALCTAEIDGVRLSYDAIHGFISLFMAAGGETTDKALASLLKNLIEHPHQMARVRSDRSLIPRALIETLRYSPPVQIILRCPLEEVTMTGGTIPANATVACVIGAANRDERRFKDPDRFDLFRGDLDMERAFTAGANHAAFALGRHFCAGAILARTEMEIAMNALLDALAEIRFAGEPPVERGVFLRAPAAMKLRFSPASGSA